MSIEKIRPVFGGLYVDRNHSFFVVDFYNDRVLKYDDWNNPQPRVVAGGRNWYYPVNAPNQLHGPHSVFVDEIRDNAMYIGDRNNHRIQKWIQGESFGTTILSNASLPFLPAQFYPLYVQIDENGMIYVPYWSGILRASLLDLKWFVIVGGIERSWELEYTASKLEDPGYFVFDSNFDLFVNELGKDSIWKFSFNASSC
ncbi:unnamed protein product [Rotaria sordida]|uniref:Uncharacterized protein n=1 Tax=Rotaria sordida TaxID=392033 RepID=A0A815FWJ5_9BILA|nr:unnamed protein product [Rotaria sordida]CAF1591555.1 unnamed protein product [Rotaria sordida]